jgi:hypothetical protein
MSRLNSLSGGGGVGAFPGRHGGAPVVGPAAANAPSATRLATDGFEKAPEARAPVHLNAVAPVTDLPVGGPDKQYDGMLVGAGGHVYRTGTPLSEVPAVQPDASSRVPRNTETIIYTNGILTDLKGQQASLQAIANVTGSNVIGVHNSTEGAIKDLLQCVNDKSNNIFARNPAVDSLSDTIHDQLRQGKEVHLMGHSQGGLITSRALSDLKARLTSEDGMTTEQAETLMSRIKVETFGAAAASYPDGPQYTHNINRCDLVPSMVGLGVLADVHLLVHPGRGAKVNYFTDQAGGIQANHAFNTTYLNHRTSP